VRFKKLLLNQFLKLRKQEREGGDKINSRFIEWNCELLECSKIKKFENKVYYKLKSLNVKISLKSITLANYPSQANMRT
jgi:hypothetical protein